MAAACALVHMATHRGGATLLDGNEYLQVEPGEPGRTPIRESVACCAYQIGQLQEWPLHLLTGCALWVRRRCEHERVERAGGGTKMALRHVQVSAGGLQIGMPQQELNRTDVRTGFE